jgi:L-arabinokinase
MQHIAYYITPHGFGHAVRSLEVIRCLLLGDNELQVTVVSDVPEFLVRQCVGKSLPFRKCRLDIGLVQKDSVRFDLEATKRALEILFQAHETIIDEEISFFQEEAIQGIVSDIAFLPFYASSRFGIPGIGLSNFTWDWIYQSYARSDPSWESLIAWIREGYEQCTLFLQLPMHGDCDSCPNIRDVPLIARKAQKKPSETRELLQCDPRKKHYLISFTDLDLKDDALRQIEGIDDAVFYFKHPLNFRFSNGRSLDGYDLSYPDIVAAVDGVITKPGYGIVSDCIAHGTPIVYSDRGQFPEYDVLVRDIKRCLANVYLPSRDLYAGLWRTALFEITRLPRHTPTIRGDGGSVCAELIRNVLKGTSHAFR